MNCLTVRLLISVFSAALLASGCGLTMEKIPSGAVPDKSEKDHMITLDGVNYHYTEYPALGQDIVMIHGYAASTYTWEECAGILQKQGYHVWALDMKGFGWSGKPRDADYSPLVLGEEVYAWMKALKLKNVAMVGNSLGGGIAWAMAIVHPEMISRLVLIDAAGYKIKKPFIIELSNAPLAEETMNLFFGKWLVKALLCQVFYDDSKVTGERINAYYLRQCTENALYAQIQVGRKLDFALFETLLRRVPEITKKTLIIWGRDDNWIPLESAAMFRRDIKNSSIAVIPECGHIPMEEQPEITASLILDFMRNKPVDKKYVP
ncbi:MAG TPA: alpha/beta hydrolase [Spirochaetota bacterium]|nr:alpha/beta hydrolase [Spirochaetota bacterium]HPI87881.1 alpha/beta hydrolase [Spirochaetota bacterium]HPR47387.1 alpha/beta hydrolase [Spirochaetota bacterium]